MKYSQSVLTICLLAIILLLSVRVYQIERQKRVYKAEYIELSKAKYGIFNIDTWKNLLSDIISKKIDEFDFSAGEKDALRERVSNLLYDMINGFEGRYYEDNSKTFGGVLKNAGASVFGIFKSMRRDVPNLTEQILTFMEDPTNRDDLKQFIYFKIDEYASKTFADADYRARKAIISKHGCSDTNEARAYIGQYLQDLTVQSRPWVFALFGLNSLLFITLLSKVKLSAFSCGMAILGNLIMLFAGISLPMIDIDARIDAVTFTFLGERLQFYDQVLYYKSKSILEVVWLMLDQGGMEIIFVALLVLVFSVLFPLAKSLAGVLYLSNVHLRRHSITQFLLFRTGKWSMADVMVIAIFMAYIGFSSILSEQLNQFEGITRTLDILTTNESQLQIGFFFFTYYVLLSLALSRQIKHVKAA